MYINAFTLDKTSIVKARVFKTGVTDSGVASSTFTIKAATPTILTNAGTYTNSVRVTITSTTSGATIRYTTNGSTPTSSSTAYSSGVTLTSSKTIKAAVFKSGVTTSNVASRSYTIKAAAPTFNKGAGTYTDRVAVSLSTSTPGGIIRYTTNGKTPSSSSSRYTGAITLTRSKTIKARTYKSGVSTSSTASRKFSIKAKTPSITYQGGTPFTTVYISSSSGAGINYTTDGTIPSFNVGGRHTSNTYKYPGKIKLPGSGCGKSYRTIRAFAFGSGFVTSSVASRSVAVYGTECGGGGR